MPDDLTPSTGTTPTAHQASAAPPPPRAQWSFPFLVGLAARLAVLLLLMGFGFVLAESDLTGLPYGSLFGSPAELISIGAMAIVAYFDFMGSGAFAALWWESLEAAVPLAFACGALVLIAQWPGWTDRVRSRVDGWKSWIAAYFRRRSRTRAFVHAGATSLIATVAFPSVSVFGAFLLTLFVALCCTPTLLGYSLGRSYIVHSVLRPAGCVGDASLRGQPGAACVIVKVKERGVCRGRVIMGGGSIAVVLDDTHVGKLVPHRIPMADAIIEPAGPYKAEAGSVGRCMLK